MTDVQKSYPGWYTLDDALNFDAKTAIDLTLKHLNQYRYLKKKRYLIKIFIKKIV
jgi:hypothetical protein